MDWFRYFGSAWTPSRSNIQTFFKQEHFGGFRCPSLSNYIIYITPCCRNMSPKIVSHWMLLFDILMWRRQSRPLDKTTDSMQTTSGWAMSFLECCSHTATANKEKNSFKLDKKQYHTISISRRPANVCETFRFPNLWVNSCYFASLKCIRLRLKLRCHRELHFSVGSLRFAEGYRIH